MIYLLAALLSGAAYAQDFAGLFVPGPSPTNLSFEESFYQNAKISHSDDKLEQKQWRAKGNTPVWNNGKQEITFGLEAGDLVLHHPSPVLHPYRTIQGTLGWRYYGQENKTRGLSLSYGSASDRPFARASNEFINANYLHQFSSGKWWGAVNYSNNRSFANGIPLPGFFYVSKASREETLLLGLPFVFWRKRFENGFDTQVVSFFPWNHQMHVGWFWNPSHGVTLGFEHRPQQFFRDERPSRRDRFFYREQKLTLAVQGSVMHMLQWKLEAGRAFNRSFFEARNFNEDKRFDIPVDDTYFIGAQASTRF